LTYQELLLERAEMYWLEEHPLPLDLHFELAANGIDVGAAEKSFKCTNHD
jgi:hypothetical protein